MRPEKIEGVPVLGERRRADKVGKNGRSSCVWAQCKLCGEKRWARLGYEQRPCKQCSSRLKGESQRGQNHPRWRGGRIIDSLGYVQILLQADDFFYPMANKNGYAREHRIVMAKHIQRCLLPWEIVHHRNGIKKDNHIENLTLLKGQPDHLSFCILRKENEHLKSQIQSLQGRLTILEAEMVLIKEGVAYEKYSQG